MPNLNDAARTAITISELESTLAQKNEKLKEANRQVSALLKQLKQAKESPHNTHALLQRVQQAETRVHQLYAALQASRARRAPFLAVCALFTKAEDSPNLPEEKYEGLKAQALSIARTQLSLERMARQHVRDVMGPNLLKHIHES